MSHFFQSLSISVVSSHLSQRVLISQNVPYHPQRVIGFVGFGPHGFNAALCSRRRGLDMQQQRIHISSNIPK